MTLTAAAVQLRGCVATCAVARYDLAKKELTWLVTDDAADLTGWLSPDGAALLIERNDDGASELALYEAAASGHKIRDLRLPAVGTVSSPRLAYPKWAPDSRRITLSISSPELPGDALLLDVGLPGATTGGNQVRRLTHSAGAFGADAPVLPELVYGDEGHGLTKRANRADALPRAFAFLARHLAS